MVTPGGPSFSPTLNPACPGIFGCACVDKVEETLLQATDIWYFGVCFVLPIARTLLPFEFYI